MGYEAAAAAHSSSVNGKAQDVGQRATQRDGATAN
jgi:hypothetical protein